MAKLYFRYGAMNCGKTTALLQTAHNYSESGQKAIIIKPAVDTKMKACVTSRLGIKREVDLLVSEELDLFEYFKNYNSKLDCILVDEVQFLTVPQIEQLYRVAVVLNIVQNGWLSCQFKAVGACSFNNRDEKCMLLR